MKALTRAARLTALTLAALQWDCGGSDWAPPPRPPAELGIRLMDGERLRLPTGELLQTTMKTYGVTAGKMDMSFRPACEALADSMNGGPVAPAVVVESELRTAGIVSWFNETKGGITTLAYERSLYPRRSVSLVDDGSQTRRYSIKYSRDNYRFRYEKSDKLVKRGKTPLPEGERAYDTQTAFYMLRSWSPPAGTKSFFHLVIGRHLWRTYVTYHGQTSLEVDSKMRKALHLSGVAYRLDKQRKERKQGARSFDMWLSADKTRTPLMVTGEASFGSLEFTTNARLLRKGCIPEFIPPGSSKRTTQPPTQTAVKKPRRDSASKTLPRSPNGTGRRPTADAAPPTPTVIRPPEASAPSPSTPAPASSTSGTTSPVAPPPRATP